METRATVRADEQQEAAMGGRDLSFILGGKPQAAWGATRSPKDPPKSSRTIPATERRSIREAELGVHIGGRSPKTKAEERAETVGVIYGGVGGRR